jgi:uncharacterized small protein (DUF1192 family)
MDAKFAAHEARINALERKITVLEAKMETRFEAIDKRLQRLMAFVIAPIALITVLVGVPQIIIAFREPREADWQEEIERLKAEIKTLKQSRIIQP